MADESPSEEAKNLQAKLDGLDVETLQKLLQVTIANKTIESGEHGTITPATPSSTPVEVGQNMNNITTESHPQVENDWEENVDGGDDGAEIQIINDGQQAQAMSDDDVDTTNDVSQNILPENHGDGSFSSPFNQQINEVVPVLDSVKTGQATDKLEIITTPLKSQDLTNNLQVLHDLKPTSDKPNHLEITDQTSQIPYQASPSFIPSDDQSTNPNLQYIETEHNLDPTSDQFNSPLTSHQPSTNFDQHTQSGDNQKPFGIPAKKQTTQPDESLPTDQFNSPLTSHQSSTNFDQRTQSGDNQKPFGIPVEKHTSAQPDESLPTYQFNSPLTSHQPSTNFDQRTQSRDNQKHFGIPAEKQTTQPDKSLPTDQFNSPLTSHQPSTNFDQHTQSGDNQKPFGIAADKHTTQLDRSTNQPGKRLPNYDQFSAPLMSHQPSTSFDQHNKKPSVVPAEETRPDKRLPKEWQNPFASPEGHIFESKLHSTSFDQSYHTVTVSPHDIPSEVPPVFVPLSKLGEYLPEGMVILDTKARIPLALKPFIVLNDQAAMIVFERDDGSTTCKECKKVAGPFQTNSVSMQFENNEQRQQMEEQEEQATTQRQPPQQQELRVTYSKEQPSQLLQDEQGQYESPPSQKDVSPYNETSPQVRHGQAYLNQGQQPPQVFPQQQQQQQHDQSLSYQGKQPQKYEEQPQQSQPPPTSQQQHQQQQQQQQHDQSLSYQGKQTQKYEEQPQQSQPPPTSQQHHQQQQQYRQQEQEQQLNQQPLQNFSPQTNQYQQPQQVQQQYQQQQQKQQQQQHLNQQPFENFPQTSQYQYEQPQPITSFPQSTNQDPSRPQQILRSSSLPHLPTGTQIETQQAVAGQQGQPKQNFLPGLKAPAWMNDENCKSCTNCGKSFSVTRRKHHCRGCGKIFCNDCCNQLAQLPYLGKKIARVCVNCTRTIRKAHFDKAKHKKNETTRRYSQSSAVSPPTRGIDHSLFYIPNEDMRPAFNKEPTIPEDNFNLPQRASNGYQSLTNPSGNFNLASDLPQSMPDVSGPPSPSQVGNSSYNDRMSFDTKSQTGRFPGFSQDNGFVGSSSKIPTRPAGRNVTWTNYDTKASFEEQKKRFKNLNKVLKTPEGCVIQTAAKLNVSAKKIQAPEGCVIQTAAKLNVSAKKIQVILKQELHETWFLCSHGFASSGHKEIAFLLEKRINEDVFPYEMLKVYRTLYSLIINQGERFEHGNYLTVNNPVLGSEENIGFIFMTFDKAPKLVQQHAAGKALLIGVLLKNTELTCAKYLPTRLFNAMGAQQQCFPSPAVSSRDRPSVCHIEPNELFYSTFFALNQFLNHQTPQALIPDVHILKSGSKVVLELPFAFQTEVIGILDSLLIDESKQVTVPIAGDLVPEASGHFVYSPSNVSSTQRGFVVLQNSDELPGNQYLAFSAILLVLTFGDACNSRTRFGIEVIEDGIIVTLSDSQARELRQAIYQGTNCAMSVGNSADSQDQFTLRWTSDTCPSILDIPTPVRVVQNVKKSTKGLFPTTTIQSQSPVRPAHVDAGQTNVIIERLKTRDIEAAIQTKIASGDPQQAVVKLENDVKQACAGCLLTFANRLRSNAEKRLNLTLALGPDNYKKWCLGPSNQPINLSRALQLALNEVEVPHANEDIVFVFNVILQKRN